MMIMTAKDFFKQFPDESACVHHMKKMREKNGLVCRKCASKRLSWLSTINRWECMDCRAKTTIRSGTIMMHSKLPLHTWYYCMFLMMTTTKAVSAKDMQQRLGMKRYEPVWYMMQKIRLAMGKAIESVKLDGTVEFDDGFFALRRKRKIFTSNSSIAAEAASAPNPYW
jgi:ribosomal protein L33